MIIVQIAAALAALIVIGLAALWLVGERGRVLGLPSTRAALKGTPDVPPRKFSLEVVHGYVYSVFPFQYIGFCINWLMERMGPRFGQWWGDHYHGKVLPLELAEAIITLDHDIPRMDLEQIIPYPTAREIVLEGPPSVVLMECPCRHSRENPCTPTDVCMIVGDGAFVLDHHPDQSRAISQQEALDLLRAEHERGHVHAAYFKDACDNRFYAICNCCPCCCGGLEAMVKYGIPMVTSSGYLARIDADQCEACGTCESACPFDAIHVNGHAAVTFEACMGCGVCVGQCPNDAIELVQDERKGIPLDVRTLAVRP